MKELRPVSMNLVDVCFFAQDFYQDYDTNVVELIDRLLINKIIWKLNDNTYFMD